MALSEFVFGPLGENQRENFLDEFREENGVLRAKRVELETMTSSDESDWSDGATPAQSRSTNGKTKRNEMVFFFYSPFSFC